MFEQNNDMVAWLTINGTNINYPVMQTKKNPNFYLRKNFYKEYSYYGTPYIDERCDAKESDNLIIYGHHIKNNKMFGELEKYKKENYYKEHKIIELTTLDNVYKYEIVFAFKTDIITGFKYFNYYDFKNKEDFNEFYNKCKELSFHTSNSEIKYTDKLITLSTCEYSSENGRLAIIAKRL